MSTPRKRRRSEDGEDQGEQISKEELRVRGHLPSHPDSGVLASSVDLASPKKRSLKGSAHAESDLPHQYAPDAPPLSSQPTAISAKQANRIAPRSPGPGFITSSPMNKKVARTSIASTKNIKPLKPARRLSDEFDAIAAETPSIPSHSDPTPTSTPQTNTTNILGSDSHTGSATSSAQNSQSTNHHDSHPHGRHASLNNPHGDQVDENNTSVMDSIFSPGLRSYVTQQFHALTSSLGIRSSQELERDYSLSHSTTSIPHGHGLHHHHGTTNSSNGQLRRSSHLPDTSTSSIARVQLPAANGIHHAAYRRPHHGLSAPSSPGDVPFTSHVPSLLAKDKDTSSSQEEPLEAKGEAAESENIVPLISSSHPNMHATDDKHHLEVHASNISAESGEKKKLGDGDKMETSARGAELASPGPRHRKKVRSRRQMVEEEEEEEEERARHLEMEAKESKQVDYAIMDHETEDLENGEDGEGVEEEEEGEEVAEDLEEEEFDSYLFMANVPPLSSLVPPAVAPPRLPLKARHAPKVTLALDLDETLVHCSLEKIDNPDLIFAVSFEGEEYQVYVRKRPGFEEFLSRVSELFEVAVFTASQKAYADKLLNILDPQQRWVHHRLFRESCVFVLGNYLKDLNVLGREMSKVIIVDNSPHVFAYQLDNGIPIESWYDDSRDRELLNLLPFLETLANCHDVRPLIRGRYQVHKKVEDSRRAYQELASLARERHLLPSITQTSGSEEVEGDDHDKPSKNQKKSKQHHNDETTHRPSSAQSDVITSNDRSTSLIEGDTDDDSDDQRTTPIKPSRRKSRVRSRIHIAQYDSDSDPDTTPSIPIRMPPKKH